MTTDSLEIAQAEYQAGKIAFERGEYRRSVQCLEKAASLVERRSRFGGEVQIWLVMAYEAAGQRTEAIDLGEQISRHPDLKTRKQGSRLLYILKAPKLQTRPEWFTQIPDLSNLEDPNREVKLGASVPSKRPPRPRPQADPEPIDWSQINTKDNQFVWVALGAIALIAGFLVWFNQGV